MFGARPSDAHKLATTLRAELHPTVALRLSAPLALVADLGPWECTRPNQGASEGCAAHSVGAATFTAFAAIGQPGILPSFRYLYSASGMLEGAAVEDNGRQIADVMTVLRKGWPLFEGMSPDGRFSDICTASDGTARANVLDPPSSAELLAKTFALGQHTVNLKQDGASDVCAAVLTASRPAPLVVGSYVGRAFLSATTDSVIDVEPVVPGEGGGHAVQISGYRTVNGLRQFLVTNSWGFGWANRGRVWVTESWLLNCWEAWAMTLTLNGGVS